MFLRSRETSTESDEALFARLHAGGHAALEALWQRYAHLVFGVAMKYLKEPERAKDLVMETFAELPVLSAKHRVQAFRPWLHSVVRNRCLMALRKKGLQQPSYRLPSDGEPQVDESILREASLSALEAAMEQLPQGQSACIRLFHLEGHCYQQVAEATGFSVEQVRSHLQNGRRNLRNILERHGIRP
jgi:RNA polymerase sigma factor (sigma-70 family)